MSERVSDERLATLDDEVQKWGEVDLPGDESAVRDLCERALLDLRDARAALAAWEPVVRAAVAERSEWVSRPQGFVSLQVVHAAVDALPPEHRP